MPEIKSVEVLAEVYFRDSNVPVECYLLGEDNKLYKHNDLKHTVRPFSQRAILRHNFSDEDIERILEHSILLYKDGRTEKREGYYNGR